MKVERRKEGERNGGREGGKMKKRKEEKNLATQTPLPSRFTVIPPSFPNLIA